MRLALIIAAMICAGSFTLSCKRQSSQLKTLESLADGSFHHQGCKGSFPLSKKIRLSVSQGDQGSLNSLLDAVSSIPPSLQDTYFNSDGGHVFATNDFALKCEQAIAALSPQEQNFFTASQSAVSSCLRHYSEGRSLILQIVPDQTVIANELVRVFGLLYGKVYGPRRFSDWSSFTARLGSSFAREVATSGGKFSLKPYEPMFSSSETKDMFDLFVFGDAFDSYYCNEETRQSFAQNFHDTFLIFNVMAKKLESYDAKSFTVVSEDVGTNEEENTSELVYGSPRSSQPEALYGSHGSPESFNPKESIDADLDRYIQNDISNALEKQNEEMFAPVQKEISDSIDRQYHEYAASGSQFIADSERVELARRKRAALAARITSEGIRSENERLRQAAEAERQRKEVDPDRARKIEECINGFENGACVASQSAKDSTRTLLGDDIVELMEYRQNGFHKTGLAQLSGTIEKAGDTAGAIGAVYGAGATIASDPGQTASRLRQGALRVGAKKAGNAIIDANANGIPTLSTPSAVTTIEVGSNGIPSLDVDIPNTDKSAALGKLMVEGTVDASRLASVSAKNPIIAVPVFGTQYAKWMTKSEIGPGAGNAVQEKQNQLRINQVKELNSAIKKVAARDPEWYQKTTLPTEVANAAAKFHNYHSRQDGAVVEELYWQSWLAARSHHKK